MEEDKHILIEKFFSNELSAEEKLQFEKLLAEDAAFRDEVLLQRDVLGGIGKYGEDLMKAEIAAIGMEAKGTLQDYKPDKGGGGFGKILGLIVFVAAIAGLYLFYTGKINHEQEELPVNEIKNVEKTPVAPAPSQAPSKPQKRIITRPTRDTIVRMETIYHTITTNDPGIGDTTVFYSKEELKNFKKKYATPARGK
jgi:hypothetical protein